MPGTFFELFYEPNLFNAIHHCCVAHLYNTATGSISQKSKTGTQRVTQQTKLHLNRERKDAVRTTILIDHNVCPKKSGKTCYQTISTSLHQAISKTLRPLPHQHSEHFLSIYSVIR